jgi:hypothetical protein
MDQWDRLKLNVLAGYGFAVSLFDMSEILNMLKFKYIEEFRLLEAETPYKKALRLIEENFKENLSQYYEFVRSRIRTRVESIDITREYAKEELYEMMQELNETVFSELYNVKDRAKMGKNRALVDK